MTGGFVEEAKGFPERDPNQQRVFYPFSEITGQFFTGLIAQGANVNGTVFEIHPDAFLHPEQIQLEIDSKAGIKRRASGAPIVFPVINRAQLALHLGENGWYISLYAFTAPVSEDTPLWSSPGDYPERKPFSMDCDGDINLETNPENGTVTGISYNPADLRGMRYDAYMYGPNNQSTEETPRHLATLIERIVREQEAI